MFIWSTWFRLFEGERAFITGAEVKFAGNRAYHGNDNTLSVRESDSFQIAPEDGASWIAELVVTHPL